MSSAGWDAPLWLETTPEDPGVGMCKQAVDEGCAVVFVCGGDGTVMAEQRGHGSRSVNAASRRSVTCSGGPLASITR